jgi:hypothetical protein
MEAERGWEIASAWLFLTRHEQVQWAYYVIWWESKIDEIMSDERIFSWTKAYFIVMDQSNCNLISRERSHKVSE